MYSIKPFGLINGVDGTLLLAPLASVRVLDEKMTRFLTELDGNYAKYFQQSELDLAFDSVEIDPDKGLKFLRQTGILESVSEHETNYAPFSDCVLISDQDTITSALKSALLFDGIKISISCRPDNIPPEAFKDGVLFVIFLENYSQNIIRKLYNNCVALNKIGFIQAYYFRHEFKIDGIYIPWIGSPCHFCHFERWRSREHHSFGNNKRSWSQVIDLLIKHEKAIPPSIPITDCDRHYAAHILRRRVQQIVGIPFSRIHQDSFITAISSDLISCNVTSEPVPHWYSCSCMKGVW